MSKRLFKKLVRKYLKQNQKIYEQMYNDDLKYFEKLFTELDEEEETAYDDYILDMMIWDMMIEDMSPYRYEYINDYYESYE